MGVSSQDVLNQCMEVLKVDVAYQGVDHNGVGMDEGEEGSHGYQV